MPDVDAATNAFVAFFDRNEKLLELIADHYWFLIRLQLPPKEVAKRALCWETLLFRHIALRGDRAKLRKRKRFEIERLSSVAAIVEEIVRECRMPVGLS